MSFEPHISLFFVLLQRAVGRNAALPELVSDRTWEAVYTLAVQHALSGITFLAVEHLPDSVRPSRELLFCWLAQAERIREQNIELNRVAKAVTNRFADAGFRSVILKGQGNALLYPQPLARTPGDIDIWLEGGRERIMQYVQKNASQYRAVYHHVDFSVVRGVAVEVHFTPSWMNNYFTNKKLQRFFSEQADRQFAHRTRLPDTGEIGVPTLAFNRVYVLVHIYRHLFYEGIGFRQFLDYYYVLRHDLTEHERNETLSELKKLHMCKFTRGVMYIMQTVFGLETRYLLIAPDRTEGEFLLNKVLCAGNFGRSDRRIIHKKSGAFHDFVLHLSMNSHLLFWYPSEVMWSPIFKIWHFLWRKLNKLEQK